MEAWETGLVHTVRGDRFSVHTVVGGSLHGLCHRTVARHACTLVSPGLPPIPVPTDTTLDQVLVHWHDSLLDVLGADFGGKKVLACFWISRGWLVTWCRIPLLWYLSEHKTPA